MVALLVLAIAMLGIVRVLAAGVEVIGEADNHRTALEAVSAVAQTAAPGVLYPTGRQAVSTPGPDGIPGTADDPAVAPRCERQVEVLTGGVPEWLWVRAWCGAQANEARGASASARLLVAR